MFVALEPFQVQRPRNAIHTAFPISKLLLFSPNFLDEFLSARSQRTAFNLPKIVTVIVSCATCTTLVTFLDIQNASRSMLLVVFLPSKFPVNNCPNKVIIWIEIWFYQSQLKFLSPNFQNFTGGVVYFCLPHLCFSQIQFFFVKFNCCSFHQSYLHTCYGEKSQRSCASCSQVHQKFK